LIFDFGDYSFIATDDDTRVDVYGWSLPSKSQSRSSDPDGKVQIQVPVPVYCRPIFNTNDKTQVEISFFNFYNFYFF
jgi:hypothetical protein